MKRNKYGEILKSELVSAIENADTIEDVANLRDLIENNDIECKLEISSLLTNKETKYGL